MEKRPCRFLRCAAAAGALTLALATANAQSAGGDFVSRKEYDALKQQMLEMQQELKALKAETSNSASKSSSGSSGALAKLHQDVDEVKTNVENIKPGNLKFMLAGGASATFSAPQGGDASNFSAKFSPI